jgi:hypothetical protein
VREEVAHGIEDRGRCFLGQVVADALDDAAFV